MINLQKLIPPPNAKSPRLKSRTRKFVGAVFIILFVTIYALIAMVLAETASLQIASQMGRLAVFAALGFGWVIPLFPLVSWMEKPDA